MLEAVNRVLAEDFTAPIDIPPFNRSAMDGYAVIASDTKGATQKQPVTLEVLGRTYAVIYLTSLLALSITLHIT